MGSSYSVAKGWMGTTCNSDSLDRIRCKFIGSGLVVTISQWVLDKYWLEFTKLRGYLECDFYLFNIDMITVLSLPGC